MMIETEEELKSKSMVALISGGASLLLSIIGTIMCLFLAPVGLGAGVYATYLGVKCMNAAKTLESNDSNGMIGMILGIIGGIVGAIGTLILAVALVILIVYIVVFVFAFVMMMFMTI